MPTRSHRLLRILTVPSPPSPRVLEVITALGMGLECTTPTRALPAARAIVRATLRPGTITLITGPSGSGKSTLLRAVHAGLLARGAQCAPVDHAAPLPSVGSLLDALGRSASEAAACLSAAGLADATLWVRPPSQLSTGERARFACALGWASLSRPHADAPPRALLWDECVTVLDRTTARAVCVSMSRLARRSGVSLVCATPHDDAAQWLAPDVHAHCALGAQPTVTAPPDPTGAPCEGPGSGGGA